MRLLIDALRDSGKLGTPMGCDTAQCGACTVLVDGRAVKSCNVLAEQVVGCRITTIEDIGSADAPHVLQTLFSKHHALQCGYCTSGMIMRALAMVGEDVPATEVAVRKALAGNLCRCTGYEGIVLAIVEALPRLRDVLRDPSRAASSAPSADPSGDPSHDQLRRSTDAV